MQISSTQRPAPALDEQLLFHDLVRRAVEPGILVLGSQGRILSLNNVAAYLLGPRPSGWLGCPLDLLPAPLVKALHAMPTDRPAVSESTVTLDPSDPHYPRRVFWLNTFPLPNLPEEPDRLLVTLHDLQAGRELERSTTRLHQLADVGLLAAGVAHEVKNAMVAVKTYAELLLESQPHSEEATLVRQELHRIDSLIGRLLQLAAPPQTFPSPVHLHEILSHVLRLVQPRLHDQAIQPVVLFEAAEDRVLGDPRQLEQAFLNLLINAAEAIGRQGQVCVRTELVLATEHLSKFEPSRRQQYLQVEVRDSGPGMSPELLSRLFSPFVTTKSGGTGLGLAITRSIIHDHRGRITVESQTGTGSAFRVLLPLLPSDPSNP